MSTAYLQGKWPSVAGALLVDPIGRVLLQHRDANAPTSPNLWGMPGGHIEPGETVEEALRRELFEETGLRVDTPLHLFCHFFVTQRQDGSIYIAEDFETLTIGSVIRETSIFFGQTTAHEKDLVLGEGDALRFFAPHETTNLSLTPSLCYALPHFLRSQEYKKLSEGAAS